MYSITNKVSWPGWMVVEPTTARGGQHPSINSTCGSPRILRGWPPALLKRKVVRTELSNCR
jgi:hypothetical protein